MAFADRLRADIVSPRNRTAALLIPAALLLMSGEAAACPYHNFGGPQRFGPFDEAGGWRGAQDGIDVPAFDTGPTATQIPATRHDDPKPELKTDPEERVERQE